MSNEALVAQGGSHPALIWELFHQKEQYVLETRLRFSRALLNASPALAPVAIDLLEEKRRTAYTPLLGELMPWMLQDVCGSDDDVTKHLAIGWLGLYAYICLLDDDADLVRPTNPDKALAGMLLMNVGLGHLYEMLPSPADRRAVCSFISNAIEAQYADIHDETPHTSVDYKAWYAAGKNHTLLALAHAFAAVDSKRGQLAIQFIVEILPAVQYLDDLSDWREDIEHGSYTVLLSRAAKKLRPDFLSPNTRLDDNLLMHGLLASGALLDTLRDIELALGRAIISVDIPNSLGHNAKPTQAYIIGLHRAVRDVGQEVEILQQQLPSFPGETIPAEKLEQLKKALLILQGTT